MHVYCKGSALLTLKRWVGLQDLDNKCISGTLEDQETCPCMTCFHPTHFPFCFRAAKCVFALLLFSLVEHKFKSKTPNYTDTYVANRPYLVIEYEILKKKNHPHILNLIIKRCNHYVLFCMFIFYLYGIIIYFVRKTEYWYISHWLIFSGESLIKDKTCTGKNKECKVMMKILESNNIHWCVQ